MTLLHHMVCQFILLVFLSALIFLREIQISKCQEVLVDSITVSFLDLIVIICNLELISCNNLRKYYCELHISSAKFVCMSVSHYNCSTKLNTPRHVFKIEKKKRNSGFLAQIPIWWLHELLKQGWSDLQSLNISL